MDISEKALKKHLDWKGKIQIQSRAPLNGPDDLSVAYTPGVAAPCLKIAKDSRLSYSYTRRGNMVAVITDGSAVLGLGDIGPEAAMPVMEGKCVLFKEFAGVDAFPLCIDSHDTDEIVNTIRLLQGSFGGINLEDISAPRCFDIERKLIERCDIPVFHDDQHGTAVVTAAAMINALKLTGRDIHSIKIIISGAGAAGIAIARMLSDMGASDIIICDRKGVIREGREDLQGEKKIMASCTNPYRVKGSLAEAVIDADVFIGVSSPGILTGKMVRTMAADPIIFAMANPVPEIMPEEAAGAGASVVGTGRSDYPNQINNVLAFPGIFRGALDAGAKKITPDMKMAAAKAIAAILKDDEIRSDYIIPEPFDKRVAEAVADAVGKAWKDNNPL